MKKNKQQLGGRQKSTLEAAENIHQVLTGLQALAIKGEIIGHRNLSRIPVPRLKEDNIDAIADTLNKFYVVVKGHVDRRIDNMLNTVQTWHQNNTVTESQYEAIVAVTQEKSPDAAKFARFISYAGELMASGASEQRVNQYARQYLLSPEANQNYKTVYLLNSVDHLFSRYVDMMTAVTDTMKVVKDEKAQYEKNDTTLLFASHPYLARRAKQLDTVVIGARLSSDLAAKKEMSELYQAAEFIRDKLPIINSHHAKLYQALPQHQGDFQIKSRADHQQTKSIESQFDAFSVRYFEELSRLKNSLKGVGQQPKNPFSLLFDIAPDVDKHQRLLALKNTVADLPEALTTSIDVKKVYEIKEKALTQGKTCPDLIIQRAMSALNGIPDEPKKQAIHQSRYGY